MAATMDVDVERLFAVRNLIAPVFSPAQDIDKD